MIIIIIIISIFYKDNVFSTIANFPYGPQVNIDIDYDRTFLLLFRLLFRWTSNVSDAILYGEGKAVIAL